MTRQCAHCGTPSRRHAIVNPRYLLDGTKLLLCPTCSDHQGRYGVLPRQVTDADRAAFDATAKHDPRAAITTIAAAARS